MSDSSSSIASGEIADTLRLERDRFEMALATFRIVVFAITAVASVLVGIALRNAGLPWLVQWGPALYFAVGVLLAAGMRAWVAREGATNRVIYFAIVFDLVFVGLVSLLMTLIAPPSTEPGDPLAGINWGRHTVGAGLMFMLALGSMRWHAAGATLGLVLACVLYGVNVAFFGPEPPHLIGGTLVLIAGILGIRVAGQQRRVLERFARSRLMRRFLPSAGVSAVEDGDDPYAMGTRAVTLTMMVTDLRGFTTMSEALAPEVMVAQLNAYHGAMYEEIERHGGMLEKFMGDGALAIFGWPSSPDCGATAAVACGRAMLVRLEALNVERAREGNPPLAMGIGIHTGLVVAGAIGAPGRRVEFTFLGDAVNTASRIEGLTKTWGTPLLVSSETVARLASTDGLVERGASEIRGRVGAVKLWS